MLYQRFKSSKIYLSPVNVNEHLDYFSKWLNEDTSILAFNGFYNKILNEDNVKSIIEMWTQGQQGALLIVTNEHQIIGSISLFNINNFIKSGEIGIFIEKKYQNHGYGNEAMRLIIEYAFNILNFRYLVVNCYSHNINALPFYKKLGFKEYGCLKDGIYYNGSFFDVHMLQLFRQDYK